LLYLTLTSRHLTFTSTLTHPNVITTYGMCATVQLCSVMEYADYGSLKHFLQSAPASVRLNYTHKIALDVARGVEYLHSRGITHCRLKSSNILLKGELTDGTFARLEVKVGPYSPATEEFILLSSKAAFHPFVAPEVPLSGEFTAASDAYSFGMLLCHLFSDGAAEPKSPSELAHLPSFKTVNQKWKDLIFACTQADPDCRPSLPRILSLLNDMTGVSAEGDMMALC